MKNLPRGRTLLPALAAVLACAVMAAPAAASSPLGPLPPIDLKLPGVAPIDLNQLNPGVKPVEACGPCNARSDEVSPRALAASTVYLLNRERTSRGLRPLRINGRLSTAARGHTKDMVRRRYFAHTSRRGSTPGDRIRRTGYLKGARSWMVGENLARGSGSRSTPRSIVDAWMHSSGHRRNILTRRFREIGIGVASRAPTSGSSAAATYTTTFGQSG